MTLGLKVSIAAITASLLASVLARLDPSAALRAGSRDARPSTYDSSRGRELGHGLQDDH